MTSEINSANPASDICPFGPEYQMFWNMRYQLFRKFDAAAVDASGLYTMVPESLAIQMAKFARGQSVLDVCSGIGSMSIAFARLGLKVTSVEIDPTRVEMARHNAALYAVDDLIDFRCGDITDEETLRLLPGHTDVLWFDPPWGTGVGEYRERKIIRLKDLTLAGLDLRELVGKFSCNEVLLRVPRNFDIGIFDRIRAEKYKFEMKSGFNLWHFIRTSRSQFMDLPDRSC